MEGHQIYNLHPEGYAVPVSQPGFVVQQNQVIPYTFETIPMEMTYFSRTSERASREQLAIAVMEHSGYQPIGVSETELVEMWSLLEDDGGPSAIQSDTQTYTTNTTHMANLSDGDARIEKWDNLPGRIFLAAQLFDRSLLKRLSRF
ncbi:hypothetical protein QFC19_005846 [Naganishia cerealis]|uniref:Uncharacterized protein n=1 Tax=Naganishia cerealis TaxID=610337 RepID=A0ACC2VKV9_9TREE|nr:hypothetical protein QFC19_005846 [Naganishia cerealis]